MIKKLKNLVTEKNCLGTITQDKTTKKYFSNNFNDMGFIFDTLKEYETQTIELIKKIDLKNGKYIYETIPQNLIDSYLTDYETAINDFE